MTAHYTEQKREATDFHQPKSSAKMTAHYTERNKLRDKANAEEERQNEGYSVEFSTGATWLPWIRGKSGISGDRMKSMMQWSVCHASLAARPLFRMP